MTEGNGHVIDPAGDARRVLEAAVAQWGPQALSNAAIMDGICRDRLSQLPGEAILIGSAARADVPALLRARIAADGADGAIRSVATTLAQASALDPAASVWVVREYARVLGFLGSDGTTVPAAPRERNRNALGIAAAAALVAVYLAVAALAHLSPFPAQTVTTAAEAPAANSAGSSSASSSSASSPAPAGSVSPVASPDPAPDADASPPSAYDTLLGLIPAIVQGQDNCRDADPTSGATAEAQCTGLQGLAATYIDYYLYASSSALNDGFSSLLTTVKFPASSQSCTTNNQFSVFVAQCKTGFASTSPVMTGNVAEYVSTQQHPIIISTDNQQLVMAVLIGTNKGDLLSYWKPLAWVQR